MEQLYRHASLASHRPEGNLDRSVGEPGKNVALVGIQAMPRAWKNAAASWPLIHEAESV